MYIVMLKKKKKKISFHSFFIFPLLHYLGTVSIFLPLLEDSVMPCKLGKSRIAILQEFFIGIHKFEYTYTFLKLSID